MGYKLYAPNEDHNCDYGVDFINGVGFTSDATVAALFESRGYTKVVATALSSFDALTKAELQAIAEKAGIVTTKTVDDQTVNKSKLELVAEIDAFIDKGILPYVSNVASSGLTNLVLTFSETLYDGASAVANNADLKAKFTASAGVTITSAIYATATKKITFVIADAAQNATIVYTGVTLKDSAGGALGNLSYTAGAEAWGVTA